VHVCVCTCDMNTCVHAHPCDNIVWHTFRHNWTCILDCTIFNKYLWHIWSAKPTLLQSGIALVFQVLSVCGCVATVVLSTMGLVDDVKLLDKPGRSTTI